MSQWPFDPATETYVSLGTFRRDGREVRTPVWLARANGLYYVFSEGAAGKVKRLRSNDRIRMAACTFRGVVSSAWLEGHARVVSDPMVVAGAYRAFAQKYGWQMRLANFVARLSGRFEKRAMIEIRIAR